jgi:transposase
MLTWAGGLGLAAGMSNVLSVEKRQQVIALGRLGWSLRRIEEATGVRRETASAYLKAAGIALRPPRRWGRPPKPANEVSTDSATEAPAKPANAEGVSTDSDPALSPEPGPAAPPGHSPMASRCEPYRELIAAALARGRNAMAIWQDLVDGHGFPAGYASVMRFVRQVRGAAVPEAHAVIQTPPGEEGQVDYGDGPMVRHPTTGKYRRTRLFVFTLGYSRKSVRLLTWRSSTRIWAELHERAFRRLGGAPSLVVLDNLREGVLQPDVYDPTLNPLYRDVLAHYDVTALPCRVRDPDRKAQASDCTSCRTCDGSWG